jgi:hypothetical protein
MIGHQVQLQTQSSRSSRLIMKVFLNTTTLLLMGSTLISGWTFTWDVGSANDRDDSTFCKSISHRCDDRDLNRERCDKKKDPAYYNWDRGYGKNDKGRGGCVLTLYSDANCETGRQNKYSQTVETDWSDDTKGNWEIRAYTVDHCKERGDNGPPDNGPPHHDDPPHEGPRCHWEEGRRKGEEGHCEGGEECRRRRRNECERR